MQNPYVWDAESSSILSSVLAEKYGLRIQQMRFENDGGLSVTYTGPSEVSKEDVLNTIAETEEVLNGTHSTP